MQAVKSSCVIFLILILNVFSSFCFAQTITNSQTRAIQTAVPILRFSPDARGSAMGNAGTALSPDVNATFWNPSKIAFLEKEWNFGLSYSPVFRSVTNDMWFGYFSAAKKLNDKQAIAISSRYFEKGDIELVSQQGNLQSESIGSDFTLDVTFAQKVSDKLSLALTPRYIRTSNAVFTSNSLYAIFSENTVSVDLSMFYATKFSINEKNVDWNVGINISNLGAPIYYGSTISKEYLPANLAIGTALTHHLNQNNLFTLAFDVNKLLVPTPNPANPSSPIAQKTVLSSIFSSFSDAPNGFREEMQELILALGVEYSYKNTLKIRSGYYQENENKGYNRYFTFGLGIERKALALNASFIKSTLQQAPNDEMFQVSLICAFGSKKENL
jgi:hypothetical protein